VPRAPQRYLENARHKGRVPRAPLCNAKIKIKNYVELTMRESASCTSALSLQCKGTVHQASI